MPQTKTASHWHGLAPLSDPLWRPHLRPRTLKLWTYCRPEQSQILTRTKGFAADQTAPVKTDMHTDTLLHNGNMQYSFVSKCNTQFSINTVSHWLNVLYHRFTQSHTWIFIMVAERPCSAADWTLWTAAPTPGTPGLQTPQKHIYSLISFMVHWNFNLIVLKYFICLTGYMLKKIL